MRVMLLTLLFITTALAGCTSDDPTTDNSETDDGASGTEDILDDTDLEDDGPPMLPVPPDLWGDETELVLVDDTFRPEDSNFYPTPTCSRIVFFWFESCALVTLPEGTLVPHGTASLVVDVDAGSAQGAGDLGAEVSQTAGRTSANDESLRGDPQSGTELSWTFDLEPRDWDLSTAPRSELQVAVLSDGVAGGIFGTYTGSFQVTVTAHRDPDWEPMPRIDHFRWTEGHHMPQAGVITLLDANLTYESSGIAQRALGVGDATEAPAFEDLVLRPTAFVVLAITWKNVEGCNEGAECTFVLDLLEGDTTWDMPTESAGPDHRIVVFPVPDTGRWDAEDASESDIGAYMSMTTYCPHSTGYGDGPYCGIPVMDNQADVRFIAEAWEGDVDVDTVKERLGV